MRIYLLVIQLCGFHSVNRDSTDKLGNGSVIVVMRTLCVPGSQCVMGRRWRGESVNNRQTYSVIHIIFNLYNGDVVRRGY